MTAADFEKGDLIQRISRITEKAGVPMQRLVIEITEQVLMGRHNHGVARTLEALRANGQPLALDDFGTGFSSLPSPPLPVDIIKIDHSFVEAIDSGARSGAIVESLLTMTRRLGMKTIAEGIETQSQAQRLAEMGCRLGQGYLYSPPVPAPLVRELLQRFGRAPDGKAPRRGAVADAA